MLDRPSARRADQQGHFRRPLLQTPFHARICALMETADWYGWAGYQAPSVIRDAEHEYFAIRNSAALFDLSPMVKYRIEGPGSEAFLQKLTLRDVAQLRPGRVHYTAWCDDRGKVLDDGTLFRLTPTRFRLCCQERHLPWLADTAIGFDVAIEEETEAVAGLALQGPTSAAVLRAAGCTAVETLKPFGIAETVIGGVAVTLSRTGFTGDLGYELLVAADDALDLWDGLWEAGKLHGLQAIGYRALNVARIEAGFIVANADFVTAEAALRPDRPRSPFEIGLGWMIAFDKGCFNGRRALVAEKAAGGGRWRLVGLEIDGNVPAEHAIVYHRRKSEAGLVTSGVWSPTAKRNIAIASLRRPYGEAVRDDLWVEVYAMRELQYAKLMLGARVVERPFVRLARRSATPPGAF
jgi:aminomethyltransferase